MVAKFSTMNAFFNTRLERWREENGPFAMWHKERLPHPYTPKTVDIELYEMVVDLVSDGHKEQCAWGVVHCDNDCWCREDRELDFS